MIGRCAISILVIIWAKNIVEAVYGKQNEVFDAASNLGDIWSWILADKNIPILYHIITRAIGIIWLVILILLIIQWFKILTNPSKAENFQKLWKSILYTVIWLFIIWIVYLLANAFILN
jgi:heme/copper-type cytochrome/quinol oxidase subunit 2